MGTSGRATNGHVSADGRTAWSRAWSGSVASCCGAPELRMVGGWYRSAMQTTIDAAGRIVVPKALREELGLTPGSTVDISRYGFGLQVVPGGRSGHLEVVDGRLVLTGEGEIDNEDVLRLLDAGRR